MKKILLLLVFLAGYAGIRAQKSPEARKVLDATAGSFDRKGGVKADFSVENIAAGQSQGKISGTMYLKGNKFQMTTPEMITWFNGKTQWSYIKDNQEVNVSNPTSEELSTINPYAFLNLYKKGYHYGLKEVKLRGKDSYEVHLRAESAAQKLTDIIINVDKSNNAPMCIRLKQNNTWTRIIITNFAAGQKLKDALFTFNSKDYPQAEVIDLR